jgi:RsiG-like
MTPSRETEEELLDPSYLDGLERRPLDEVRAMHETCLVVETELSYVRRLAQARIDILRAEKERRATGGSVSDLLAKLPEILSDPGPRSAPVASRLPRHLAPDLDEHLHGGLDEVVADGTLASLPTLSDAELDARLDELRETERDVSVRRRAMFDVIDRIEADLTERHKVGRA